jgi:hypothetical protein
MSDRSEAREATIVAYARKYGESLTYSTVYDGGFPYQDVADSIPVTKLPDLKEHQRLWDELYSAFSTQWSKYLSGR